MGVALDVGSQEQAPGLKELKYNAETGDVTAKMTESFAQKIVEGSQKWDRALVGMQEEIDRLTSQEQRARATPPILALIQKLGANLAMQEDQPGFVRALGMTSAQLNPDADATARAKLPVYLQIAQLEEQRSNQLARAAGIYGSLDEAKLRREAQVESTKLREETETQNAFARANDTLNRMAENTILTPDAVREVLGKKASEATVQAWVKDSENRANLRAAQERDRKLNEESKRIFNAEAAATQRERANRLKAQTAYDKARTAVLPQLMRAKIGDLDARAYYHMNAGLHSGERIALETAKFQQALTAWQTAKALDKVRIYNEILGNFMAPDEEKQRLYEELRAAGGATNVQPPTLSGPVPMPSAYGGGAAGLPAPAAGGLPAPANAPVPGGQDVSSRFTEGEALAFAKTLKEGEPKRTPGGPVVVLMGGRIYTVPSGR